MTGNALPRRVLSLLLLGTMAAGAAWAGIFHDEVIENVGILNPANLDR